MFKHIAIIPLCGGFSIGATNITKTSPAAIFSYKTFEANDKLYLRYLKKHNINVPYYQIDSDNFNVEDIEQKYKNKIHITHSIPPCVGLSQSAQRKAGSRGTCEANNWMYLSSEFSLKHISPLVHVFENAPNLFTNAGVEVRKRLVEIGQKFGYAITFYKTNTLYHGIPQFRPRTFGIFYKGNHAPILNNYRQSVPHQIEYFKQIPKDATLQNEYVCSEWDITKIEIFKYLNKLYGKDWRKVMNDYKPHLTTYDYLQRVNLLDDFQAWQKVQPDATEIVTKNIEHIKKKAALGKGARINYRVLEVDKDYTYAVIGEMMGKQIHPVEDRLLNMREFCHLMGLPMDYELNGPKEYVKISQNVPVATTEDITREIIAIIKGNRSFAKTAVLMQDNTKESVINNSKKLF